MYDSQPNIPKQPEYENQPGVFQEEPSHFNKMEPKPLASWSFKFGSERRGSSSLVEQHDNLTGITKRYWRDSKTGDVVNGPDSINPFVSKLEVEVLKGN